LENQEFANESVQSRQTERGKHGDAHPAAKQRCPLHQSTKITDATRSATLFEQSHEVEQRGGSDPVVKNLHEHTAQCRMRVDFCSYGRRGGYRKESEHAVAEVIDRQVSDHSF